MTPSTKEPAGEPEDGSLARPTVLPRPTYWPAAMAFGVTLLFWGLVTSLVVLGAGLLVMAMALKGWIGELLHEQR